MSVYTWLETNILIKDILDKALIFYKRWEQHLVNDKNDGFHINLNRRDFEFSVLINCQSVDLNFIEAFFIKKYKTLEPYEYNLTMGNYKHLSTDFIEDVLKLFYN